MFCKQEMPGPIVTKAIVKHIVPKHLPRPQRPSKLFRTIILPESFRQVNQKKRTSNKNHDASQDNDVDFGRMSP